MARLQPTGDSHLNRSARHGDEKVAEPEQDEHTRFCTLHAEYDNRCSSLPLMYSVCDAIDVDERVVDTHGHLPKHYQSNRQAPPAKSTFEQFGTSATIYTGEQMYHKCWSALNCDASQARRRASTGQCGEQSLRPTAKLFTTSSRLARLWSWHPYKDCYIHGRKTRHSPNKAEFLPAMILCIPSVYLEERPNTTFSNMVTCTSFGLQS